MFYSVRMFNVLISDDWARSCYSEIIHSLQSRPRHVLTQLPKRFPTHLLFFHKRLAVSNHHRQQDLKFSLNSQSTS